MKSLAIIGLALLSSSATASSIYADNELGVQGNFNTGIFSVNDRNAHMGNNQGIINVFGSDGRKSAPNNNGFINVLPFHIVREDDESGDNELAIDFKNFNMPGNKGTIHFNTDAPLKNLKNNFRGNQGEITVTDSTGKTSHIGEQDEPVVTHVRQEKPTKRKGKHMNQAHGQQKLQNHRNQNTTEVQTETRSAPKKSKFLSH